MELFTGGFLLALRLIGGGWIWTLPPAESSREPGRDAFLLRLGRAVATGLLLNLLPALVLASARAWTPLADWALWLLIVGAGAIRGFRRGRISGPSVIRFAGALAWVWLLTSLPLLQPPRSEWLAGGWDPGIYQNNAVAIARDGGLQGRAVAIYSAMTEEERKLFSVAEGAYHEVFPAVPISIRDGSLPLYFFHLTPVCGAWFLRLGGQGLLVRLPAILGLWSLLPALALFGLIGLGGWRRWVGLGAWLLSPLWWYHQAIPTSEMLYLLLLLGGLLFYVEAFRVRAPVPVGALCVLFAATVNHLNTAVLAGGFLLVAAAVEGQVRAPGRFSRVLLGFGAVALAIVWNGWFAGVVMARLEQKDLAVRVILAVFSASAILSLLLLWRPIPPAWKDWGLRWIKVACVLAGVGLAVVALGAHFVRIHAFMIEMVKRLPGTGGPLLRLLRILPLLGPWAVAWAGAGMAAIALRRDCSHAGLKVLAFALGCGILLLLLAPGIAGYYPWALRRYMVFLIPFFALVQTYAVVSCLETLQKPGSGWRWAVLLLFLPPVVQGVRISAAAARVGDYPGLGRILAAMQTTIAPDAVIVADDPLWGTPLLLAGGREVVNGSLLWQSRDPDFQQRFLATLQRLRRDTGRRMLWLTSTRKDRGIYPVELGGDPEPLAEIPYAYHTVIHSRRANRFAVEEKDCLFRLYEWDGTFSLPGGQ